MSLDILIPLGTGSKYQNVELRYALRSIEKFATGFDRLFVVGVNPGFLSDKVVFIEGGNFDTNKEARIALKVDWVFRNTEISDTIAFWNDDFVLNAPLDVSQIPFYHRGELKNAIRPKLTPYQKILENTHNRLAAAGKPTLHYDVHTPINYNRQKFLSLASWWESSKESPGMAAKSVYCNNVESPGPFTSDLKFTRFDPVETPNRIPGRWIFSYNDRAMRCGIATWLEKLLPTKSRFEV